MDILYLVGNKTTCDYWDLRFSLRSIEKYGINVGRVFICGYIPKFVSDEIIQIPCKILPAHNGGDKNRNIYKQIIYAVKNSDIGINDNGNFLISMDDHYILTPTDYDVNVYPRYVKDYPRRKYRHILPLVYEYKCISPGYQHILVDTANFLKKHNIKYLNFVPHRNMRVNRYIIEELEQNGINKEIFDNNLGIEGICIVCNYEYTKTPFDIKIIFDFKSNDIKSVNQYIRKGGHFLSTNDFKINDPIYNKLLELFPNKSKFEK